MFRYREHKWVEKRLYNAQVYTTHEGIEEIKNKPQVFTTK